MAEVSELGGKASSLVAHSGLRVGEDEYVPRFDIPMCNTTIVQRVDTFGDISAKVCLDKERHPDEISDSPERVERSVRSKLLHQQMYRFALIAVFKVPCNTLEVDDVWVAPQGGM